MQIDLRDFLAWKTAPRENKFFNMEFNIGKLISCRLKSAHDYDMITLI